MKKMNHKAGAVAAIALLLSACGGAAGTDGEVGEQDKSGETLAEVVGDDGSISNVASLLESTGIAGALKGEANYTLLAPTDTAIEALGEGSAESLTDSANGALAAAILREHMVPGALTADAIQSAISVNGGEVTMRTFGSGNVTFALDGETITVTNGQGATANLTGASAIARNGSLLTIDGVLADADAIRSAE